MAFQSKILSFFTMKMERGYEFFIDQVLKVDRVNPSVASRLLGVFEVVEKLDDDRQIKIKSLLKTIIHANPSNNILEITMKILK